MTLPSHMQIGRHRVGPGSRCFIIAEIGQAHDGSLGTAHKFIEVAARAGVDGIKYQTHIADAESTPDEPFRVKFSPQDDTRYQYWQRMEFTEAGWRGLADHARDAGLLFLSSPFSFEAVELLERLDMAAWKVASGEITNLPLLERMAEGGRPLLLSSGMSPLADLERACKSIGDLAPVGLFQCTTAYPCPPELIGLNLIGELRERFGCPVGLSDHSGTPYAGLAAATLGADMIEVHLTLSRDCFGPDVPASLVPDELSQLVDGVRFIETALSHPIDKDQRAEELTELRLMFGKSVVAARDLDPGHQLTDGDLALKKPGTGIPAADLPEVIGRRLTRAIAANTVLKADDLD